MFAQMFVTGIIGDRRACARAGGKTRIPRPANPLVKALPDWKFNATDFKHNGEQMTARFQIAGTHTGELSLPMPGFPKVPASGKHVSQQKKSITISLNNGKISRLEVAKVPGGGVAGVLTQLDIPMPQMA